MADEKIVLHVDTGAMQKEVQEATAKLVIMKNSLAQLDNAMKAGDITIEDYAKKSSALKGEIQATTQAQNANIKILNQVTQHNKTAAGSVDQLKAELAILTAQYNALSQEERENTKEGQALAKQTKEVSDQLKEAGQAIGDNRRNVGAYTQGILGAIDGTGLLANITAQAQGAQQAWNATLTITKASMLGNVTALKLFKLALIATGIGAVVVLLGGLVSFLTRSQKGIDMVSRAAAGLGTVFGFLTDKLSAVGEMLVNAFSNPKEALQDLVKFIETNLLNRLKSFAVIMEAIQKRDFVKLNDGLIQLTTGVTDASKKFAAFTEELKDVAVAGAAIEKEFQRIRDAERAVNVERAQSKSRIEALKLTIEDQTKSESARIAAAKEAYALETSSINKQIQLQKEKVANIEREQKLTSNLTADNDKLAEEKMKLAELSEGSLTRQIELNNKINELNKAGADKRAADEKAAMERRVEREKIEIQLEIARAKEGTAERLDAEIKMMAFERDQKQKSFKKGTAGYELAQVEYQNQSIKLAQEFTQQQLDEQKKRADEFIALTTKEYSEALAATEDYYQKKQTAVANDYANELINKQEYEEKLISIEGELVNQQIQVAKDYSQSTVDMEQQAAERRIAIRQTEADKKKAIQEAEFATAQSFAGAFTELANLVAGQGEELSDFQKAAALFQIGIDTAASLSSLTLTAAKVSGSVATASGPFGVVTGPLAYAAYYGTGLTTILAAIGRAKQLLSADSPSAPQFRDGGILNGPSHERGGIPLFSRGQQIAEVEGGEAIINRNSTSKYKELLSAINVAGGGKPLGLNSFMAAGGISAAPAPVFPMLRGSGFNMDYKQLAREMSKVKIVTVVSEVRAGINKAEMKESKSNI